VRSLAVSAMPGVAPWPANDPAARRGGAIVANDRAQAHRAGGSGEEDGEMNATEEMTIRIWHIPSDTPCWFSEDAIDRAVIANGGPEGWVCIAVMPQDWPTRELGEFTDHSNLFGLHKEV